MKAALVILAGAIGIAGCTTMDHNRSERSMDSGFPLTYSDNTRSEYHPSISDYDAHSLPNHPCSQDTKSSTYVDPSATKPSCHDGQVPVLAPDIEKIVGKAAGVEHIAFIVVVSSDGKKPGVLRPNNAITSRELDLKAGQLIPSMRSQEISATAIKGMGSIGIVSFRGSHCLLLWPMVDGGGQSYEICLMAGPHY